MPPGVPPCAGAHGKCQLPHTAKPSQQELYAGWHPTDADGPELRIGYRPTNKFLMLSVAWGFEQTFAVARSVLHEWPC